jgi:signal transduction histidine kinase
MIKTLRKKFIFINMSLVALVLLAVFALLAVSSYARMEFEGRRAVERALDVREGQEPPPFELGPQERPRQFMREAVFVARLGADGKAELVLSHNASITQEQLEQVLAEALAAGEDSGVLRGRGLRYVLRREPDGIKAAFIDITGLSDSMKSILLQGVLFLLPALGAFFVISLFLSRWALRPVEAAWQKQRQFVADASHELKTPLTVILANVGILKSNRADTIENQIGWVENTGAEAGRMKNLVDSLLFLAKTDDARVTMVYSNTNFSDLIYSAALTFEPVAYERGVSIDTGDISPDVYVSGDGGQLGQLAGILLDNAVKYAGSGGTVTLSLTRAQEKAVLCVSNTGSYLQPEDLAHVFDRFYRADKSRTNEGYGLGLSIAKSIADRHRGKIIAESDQEKGTSFTVVIPLIIVTQSISRNNRNDKT